MSRLVIRICACLALALILAAGWVFATAVDPEYAAYEFVFNARFHRYDDIIREVSARQGIDPMLVKAVIWRESRFHPEKAGLDGERGLMQVTLAAASEWIKSAKVEVFKPEDLFEPKTNIEAGSWLLARALKRYQGKDNPLPFALAEYNAGRSRVMRWTGKGEGEPQSTSHDLQERIDIPSTRNYMETVQERVDFYHQRGRL